MPRFVQLNSDRFIISLLFHGPNALFHRTAVLFFVRQVIL